jgi:peptidoglycan/xylan/chitin deacetylase (PgdA/CDA1 family)
MPGQRVVPILEFHGVWAAPLGMRIGSMHMPAPRLRRYFRLLRLLGFRGVSVSEAVRHLDGGGSGRVVGLSFDDGYRDVIEEGLPILREYGFTATCFMVSGHVGGWNAWDHAIEGARRPLMGAADLRAWYAAGMEVGAHTRTHAALPRCSDDTLVDEVAGSRRELEDVTGVPVTQFSYPWGEHDERAVAAVRDAGFEGAVTSRRARARPSDDRHRLPRIEMRSDRGSLWLLSRTLGRDEARAG